MYCLAHKMVLRNDKTPKAKYIFLPLCLGFDRKIKKKKCRQKNIDILYKKQFIGEN